MKSIWVCVVLAVTMACSKASTTTPSGPSGHIEFSVSPSSVFWEGTPSAPQGPGSPLCTIAPRLSAWGPFVWTVRETGGGTVTITSFTSTTTNNSGRQLENSQLSMNSMALDFTGTAGASVTLGPNQSLSSHQHASCQTTSPIGLPLNDLATGGVTVFTVSGKDSNGTAVSATATLTLQSFP